LRAAGFQTCCVAGFQAGITDLPPAGLETRDIADLEVCATLNSYAVCDRRKLDFDLIVNRQFGGYLPFNPPITFCNFSQGFAKRWPVCRPSGRYSDA
jgi:hypothetical protein